MPPVSCPICGTTLRSAMSMGGHINWHHGERLGRVGADLPTGPGDPGPWTADAACRPHRLDLFFGPHDEGNRPRRRRTAIAKAICAGCPVRVDCLAWALHAGEVGIWGGTTDADRRRIRRRQYWAAS
jgi:WhiB family transcriptional regulator, redox-sensing transcriptional regulator